jgi:hypothetical protein
MSRRFERPVGRLPDRPDLGLDRVERVTLAIGISLACALIALVDRSSFRSDC